MTAPISNTLAQSSTDHGASAPGIKKKQPLLLVAIQTISISGLPESLPIPSSFHPETPPLDSGIILSPKLPPPPPNWSATELSPPESTTASSGANSVARILSPQQTRAKEKSK